jgi:hypothetical protein
VLKLKRLLAVNQLASVKELLVSQEGSHLLMIECKPNDEHQTAEALFKDLFTTVLKEKPKIKVILITQQGDNLSEFFREEALKSLGHNKYIAPKDKGFTWGDLTRESQQTLLAKKVASQGQPVVLRELLGVDDTTTRSEPLNRQLNTLLDEKVIIQLSVSIKDKPIVIGHEPLRLSDLEAAYAKRYEPIEPQNLA